MITSRNLYDAVNDACTCGGHGPNDAECCPACKVWHSLGGWKQGEPQTDLKLRAEVEGLTAERDHYRVAVHRQSRIIAGLRRAVVVLESGLRAYQADDYRNTIIASEATSLLPREDTIRAAARRGEYRGKR